MKCNCIERNKQCLLKSRVIQVCYHKTDSNHNMYHCTVSCDFLTRIIFNSQVFISFLGCLVFKKSAHLGITVTVRLDFRHFRFFLYQSLNKSVVIWHFDFYNIQLRAVYYEKVLNLQEMSEEHISFYVIYISVRRNIWASFTFSLQIMVPLFSAFRRFLHQFPTQ